MSDYKGAALMIDAFPKARALLADRGYDADWFRHALAEGASTGWSLPMPATGARPISSQSPDCLKLPYIHATENWSGMTERSAIWNGSFHIYKRYGLCSGALLEALTTHLCRHR